MPRFGRRKEGPSRSERERTVFFASDLHGSLVCFRKFVNAAKFYGADTLLLGGDISAKIVVPVVSAARCTMSRCSCPTSRRLGTRRHDGRPNRRARRSRRRTWASMAGGNSICMIRTAHGSS